MRLSYLSVWLLVSVLLMMSTPSRALNYTVNNTNDSGAGSLRQAILDANSTPSDDTIAFNVTANGTINLQSALTVDNNGTLTITGNGAENTILSGDSDNNGIANVHVLYINSGATVTVQQLTVTKGYINGSGGGIHNRGILTVNDSVFSHNTGSSNGGGIYNYNGSTLTVNDSVFSYNSAADGSGGGILSQTDGTLTINNSVFNNNWAYWNGGGVFHKGTLATVSNSVFSNNSVRLSGGGIYNSDNTMTVTNTTVSGNSAHGGGGIFNGGVLTLSDSTISGNTANNAGGVYNYKNTLTVYNSIIANSISGVDCYRADGTVNLQNSLIEDGLTCVNGTNSSNFTGDPALNADLTLSANSLAINAGDNNLIPSGITTDLAGNARIRNAVVDMGAYESTYTEAIPFITISAIDEVGAEAGTDSMAFRITRSFATNSALTVNYTITGTAAAEDYAPTLSGAVTIAANASTVDIAVTPVDDAADENDEGLTLTLVDAASYDLGLFNSATATIADNDTAGITVTPSSGLVTDEAGGTASFSVVLHTQPTVDVSIAVSSSNSSEGTVHPSHLVFTSADWNIPQTVIVTGVDDAVVDGDQLYSVILDAATSSDASYSGFNASDVSVTNIDDDTATGIPTLSAWALWLLAALLVGVGVRRPSIARQLLS